MTTYNKLYENWINSLNEEEDGDKTQKYSARAAAKPFLDKFHNAGYQEAVKWLASVASKKQVQKYMNISAKLDGQKGEDKFGAKETPIECDGLYPTQNEVGVDGSLSFPLGWAAGAEKGAKAFIYAMNDEPKIINGNPIVVFQGKFVIDGHHRWSSTYCMNPKAVMQTVNLQNSALEGDPTKVLKAVQLAIAAEIDEVPSAQAKGENLFEVDPKQVESFISKKIPKEWYPLVAADQDTMNKLELEKGDVEGLMIKILDWVPNNVKVLQSKAGKVASKFGPRTTMPQTDNAKNWVKTLRKGKIDVAPPHAGANKVTESLNISNQRLRQIVLEEIRRSKK
jgi:hypothetical protein